LTPARGTAEQDSSPGWRWGWHKACRWNKRSGVVHGEICSHERGNAGAQFCSRLVTKDAAGHYLTPDNVAAKPLHGRAIKADRRTKQTADVCTRPREHSASPSHFWGTGRQSDFPAVSPPERYAKKLLRC
jgi:hypothetical protein